MEHKKTPKIIGNRIRMAREYNKLSIADAAESFGIDAKLLDAYENGLYYPDLNLILLISKKLNVAVDFLSGYDNDITKPSLSVNNFSNIEVLENNAYAAFEEFVVALNKLPEQNKNNILIKIQKAAQKNTLIN